MDDRSAKAEGRGHMDRISVMIAEDEATVREAMADLVSSDPSMDVVGTARDADEAIELARAEKPDVALIDVKMPGGGGFRAAREIRRASPRTHVVALSAYEDRRTVLEMLRAGVVGYIVKGASTDEILRTIHRSMHGQGSLSVQITADVIHELATLLERSEGLTRELEELNRTKSELIQILSHELFTPIAAIQGVALAIADHGTEMRPDEVRDLGEGASRASDRIKRLVGNLAAAARLQREGVEVSARPVVVGEMLQAAASEFPQHRSRLRLPTDPEQLGRRLWADVGLGVRAIVMVMENALTLTEDEPVDVEVRSTGIELEIAISDRGPGVAADKRGTIFEAFTQTDSSTTRTHEGMGIGLYLARRIMHAHRGRIGVTPRAGGGSTFVLGFPSFIQPCISP